MIKILKDSPKKLSKIYRKYNHKCLKFQKSLNIYIQRYTSYEFLISIFILLLIFLNFDKLFHILFPFSDSSLNILKTEDSKLAYLLAKNEYTVKLLTVLGGIIGIILAIWRVIVADKNYKNEVAKLEHQKKELDLNIQSQYQRELNERFFKAVQLLDSPDITARIGGLYTLEKIEEEDENYHDSCLEIITNYVHVQANKIPVKDEIWQAKYVEWINSNESKEKIPPRRELERDIKIALLMLDRIRKYNEIIDLRNINFHFIDFADTQIYFSHSDLSNADLTGTHFTYQEFKKCNFDQTNFKYSYLYSCKFINSNLKAANFRFCTLWGCNLSQGNELTFMHLMFSDLRFTNFIDVDFSCLTNPWQTNFNSILINKQTYKKNVTSLEQYDFVKYSDLDPQTQENFDMSLPYMSKDEKIKTGILKPTAIKKAPSSSIFSEMSALNT